MSTKHLRNRFVEIIAEKLMKFIFIFMGNI